MDVYRQIKLKKKNEDKKEKMVEKVEKEEGIIMTKGKPCDFFVLILEVRTFQIINTKKFLSTYKKKLDKILLKIG